MPVLVDDAEVDVDVDADDDADVEVPLEDVADVVGLLEVPVLVVVSTVPPAPPLPLSSSEQPATATPAIPNSTTPTQARFRMARRIENARVASKRSAGCRLDRASRSAGCELGRLFLNDAPLALCSACFVSARSL
jgi:hypothetical protein